MISKKYQSEAYEETRDSYRSSVVYQGSREEIEEFRNGIEIGSANSENGILRSVKYTPGPICELELVYERSCDGGGVEGPPEVFGKKSASVNASLISLPLESAKNYRACWNHYLLGKIKEKAALPSWHKTRSDTVLSAEEAAKYQWAKELTAADGWMPLAKPTKPGVETIDKAVYTLTESIKCRNLTQGMKLLSGKLNKITESVAGGLSADGNWKCDSGDLSWNGKYWVARLSYTMSGDKKGWDKDLYE